MVARGAKPKSAHLRIVEGTHRTARHGAVDDAKKAIELSAKKFGPLRRPTHLKGKGKAAWDKYIVPAAWLDASREPAAIAFCELWQEFMDGPKFFAAAKHGQLRAYMSELGLTDERNREIDGEAKDEDEFFDD